MECDAPPSHLYFTDLMKLKGHYIWIIIIGFYMCTGVMVCYIDLVAAMEIDARGWGGGSSVRFLPLLSVLDALSRP